MIPASLLNIGYTLLDKGLVPDVVIRAAICALLKSRLKEIDCGTFEANQAAKMQWIIECRARDAVAEQTKKANEQHYEVPTEFMLSCLGPRAKYSGCVYETGEETLEEAEELTLAAYCESAQLENDMDVLDLGCGWGSLSLYIAEKYPKCRVTALSNSVTQKRYIDSVAKGKGLSNIKVITADISNFDFEGGKSFDRIFSIEMFEHMKNYSKLLVKVSSWLRPDALLFVQIFCHSTTPYHFADDDGWMAQNFFSGGTMPSYDLLLYFQEHVALQRCVYINGTHYARTCEDWLKRQDTNAKQGLDVLKWDTIQRGLDPQEGVKQFYRFRVFYMACAEMFAMNGGQEWGVGHYVFSRK